MRIVHTKEQVRSLLRESHRSGQTVGLVPTMGAFHQGHLSLMRSARDRCDVVVVSLFVNPAQFAEGEDLDRYPQDEARDAELAAAEDVDFLFSPAVDEIYPDGFATSVAVSGLTKVLCGAPEQRGPEHFHGVTTVVAKLFNIVEPDMAFFGAKDAQQAIAIERMARDLDFPVRIEVEPTVREADGLAMSSRNRYLDEGDRVRATALSRALEGARLAASEGASVESALDAARAELAAAGIEPEYLEARDAGDLSVVTAFNGRPILIAVAARIGGARLIDNLTFQSEPTTPNGG